MAYIRKEIVIDATPQTVWPALRDVGALHTRLVPGFVVDTRLDGDSRLVTFANGSVVRELLVDVDEPARRVAWSVVDGPFRHHNASAQVLDHEGGRTRFVWIADLLPNELADRVRGMMEEGVATIKRTMEQGRASS